MNGEKQARPESKKEKRRKAEEEEKCRVAFDVFAVVFADGNAI
jgi:hypothetical protein